MSRWGITIDPLGSIYLADISIHQTVYERLDIEYDRPFGRDDWIELKR